MISSQQRVLKLFFTRCRKKEKKKGKVKSEKKIYITRVYVDEHGCPLLTTPNGIVDQCFASCRFPCILRSED